ncbi:hypothetical protein N2152v2_008818 [Parachlorella kessleri]
MADVSFFFANPDDAPAATPLHWAALRGDSCEVQALLAANPGTVDATDGRCWTPLHWAAGAGQAECAALLVKAGGSLTARAEESFTPWVEKITKDKPKDKPEIKLFEAAGRVELANLLRRARGTDAKATSGATPLHVAAGMGHADCIRKLLQLGAQAEAANSLGLTALHLAAACGQPAALQALLEGGADTETVDGDSSTALHAAAAYGSLECLGLLVEAGARVSARMAVGYTPLQLATVGGFTACVRKLLAAGADKEAAADSGERPLHMAAGIGSVELVKVLLEAGADIEVPALFGSTPLHYAAWAGQLDTVAALVVAGANLEAMVINGPDAKTPIQTAAAEGHMEVVSALAASGADIDYQDQLGTSCLHLVLLRAVKVCMPDAPQKLQQLLDAGASVERACAVWPTPLDLMLRCIQDPAECKLPAYVPELIRMMASAGCHIMAERRSPQGLGMVHTLLLWLVRLAPVDSDITHWPRSLSSSALEVAEVLLQCAAAEATAEERDDARVMRQILRTGSIPLVTAAAQLFPGQLLAGHLVRQAGALFVQAMKALPSPGRGAWSERHRRVVLHSCSMAEALLALGCAPVRVYIPLNREDRPACAELASIPGDAFRVQLPRWASPHLRELITLAASGLSWSPEAHYAFPPRFRAAARALLLANHRGVAVPDVASPASRVHLPRDVIRLVLEKAAQPPAAWVAQLQPGYQPPASVGTRLLGAVEWAALQLHEHSSMVGVGLVAMAVAAAGTSLVVGRGR